MNRYYWIYLTWITCFICTLCAEDVPLETEPHPYTITFFQIPKEGDEASPKEKKAVKENNGIGSPFPNKKSKVQVTKSDIASKNASNLSRPGVAASKPNEVPPASNQKAPPAPLRTVSGLNANVSRQQQGNQHQSQNQTSNKRTVKEIPIKKKPEQKVVKKQNLMKNTAVQNKVTTKINHEKRKKVANLVSIVNPANARDHALSFQKGAMKHPQHTMYPMCHQCSENSTYSSCIKRKTLKKCNEGLNNICYTKSVKRNSIIHYEMGCADHNTCLGARAFPCRDGSEKCFTCCQWDKCNSSPHHGDYELDSINLDELENSSPSMLPSYLIYGSIFLHIAAAYWTL